MFNAENFANCPMHLIEQAIKVAAQGQLQQASLAAIPIAGVGTLFAATKGIKSPKLEWEFNPFAKQLFVQQAKETINPQAAQLFMRLIKEGKVPSWAIARADMELIQAAAN